MQPATLQIQPYEPDATGRQFAVSATAEGRRAATIVGVPALLSPTDAEAIRWYVEDYRKFPFEPAQTLASGVVRRLRELGGQLFESLFAHSSESRDVWELIEPVIARCRIEVPSERGVSLPPWELLWSPLDVCPVVCRAASFVRTSSGSPERLDLLDPREVLRILLVISRPGGEGDVGFRSVAANFLAHVAGDSRFELDVLRPPTFKAFQAALAAARRQGRPYTIVHFDGHGLHADVKASKEGRVQRRRRGYLVFEDPERAQNKQLVNGAELSDALRDGAVPVLLLNACRSAAADANEGAAEKNASALGSLADEVRRAGVPAVLAMQYNVAVSTAACLISNLYEGLAGQLTLGSAVARGRAVLFEQTNEGTALSRAAVHDWFVPVVFETPGATPLLRTGAARVKMAQNAEAKRSSGVIGGDDTLLNLDRAFQRSHIVALTGLVGAGKTALAIEFEQWLTSTAPGMARGITVNMAGRTELGPLLEALEAVEGTCDVQDRLAGGSLGERLARHGGLWILEGVNNVVDANATELLEAMRAAAARGARFLLLTRAPWLPSVPVADTISVTPPDVPEQLQLLEAHSDNAESPLSQELEPLLAFAQGNPSVLLRLARALAGSRNPNISEILHRERRDALGIGSEFSQLLQARFTDDELRMLSPLTLFECRIPPSTLTALHGASGSPPSGASVPALLEGLARLGLMTPPVAGSAYFRMHPELPGLMRPVFERVYDASQRERIGRAFITLLSNACLVIESWRNVSFENTLLTLDALEPTLWRVLGEARTSGRWADVRNLLVGLRPVLRAKGHHARWDMLLDELRECVASATSDGQWQGREVIWPFLESDRVDRLLRNHAPAAAALLQEVILRELREEVAAPEYAAHPKECNEALIRELVRLAAIEERQSAATALGPLQEALRLAQRHQLIHAELRVACELAELHLSPGFKDVGAATYWWAYASDLCGEDAMSASKLLAIDGAIAREEARACKDDVSRAITQDRAMDRLRSALSRLPNALATDRGACGLALGELTFERWRDATQAMAYVQEAIAIYDAGQCRYEAAQARLAAARMLLAAAQPGHAYWYALEAAHAFASFAPAAEAELREAQRLVDSSRGLADNDCQEKNEYDAPVVS